MPPHEQEEHDHEEEEPSPAAGVGASLWPFTPGLLRKAAEKGIVDPDHGIDDVKTVKMLVQLCETKEQLDDADSRGYTALMGACRGKGSGGPEFLEMIQVIWDRYRELSRKWRFKFRTILWDDRSKHLAGDSWILLQYSAHCGDVENLQFVLGLYEKYLGKEELAQLENRLDISKIDPKVQLFMTSKLQSYSTDLDGSRTAVTRAQNGIVTERERYNATNLGNESINLGNDTTATTTTKKKPKKKQEFRGNRYTGSLKEKGGVTDKSQMKSPPPGVADPLEFDDVGPPQATAGAGSGTAKKPPGYATSSKSRQEMYDRYKRNENPGEGTKKNKRDSGEDGRASSPSRYAKMPRQMEENVEEEDYNRKPAAVAREDKNEADNHNRKPAAVAREERNEGEMEAVDRLTEMGFDPLKAAQGEMAAVDRLTEMGFDPARAAQAFFACDKNEVRAANLLMDEDMAMQASAAAQMDNTTHHHYREDDNHEPRDASRMGHSTSQYAAMPAPHGHDDGYDHDPREEPRMGNTSTSQYAEMPSHGHDDPKEEDASTGYYPDPVGSHESADPNWVFFRWGRASTTSNREQHTQAAANADDDSDDDVQIVCPNETKEFINLVFHRLKNKMENNPTTCTAKQKNQLRIIPTYLEGDWDTNYYAVESLLRDLQGSLSDPTQASMVTTMLDALIE